MKQLRNSCLFALLVMCLGLTACTIKNDEEPDIQSVTPVNATSEKVEPSDFYYVESGNKPLAQVEDAIKALLNLEGSKAYYYNFADLNGDRNHEVLIFVRQQDNLAGKLFILSSDFKTSLGMIHAKGPLIVLKKESAEQKWSDLAIYKEKGQYLRYNFVDNNYQLTDNSKENVIEFNELNGVGYLSDVNDKNGFIIQ